MDGSPDVDPRAGDWGLCRAAYEKDSCGFGLIASLDDKASHWVVQTAMSSLNRLTHRGAIAADGKTGDGCGLLIKQPTAFLRAVGKEAGFKLTPMFAAGLLFLDTDPAKADAARTMLTEQLQIEKLRVAGFRLLPTDSSACGSEALKTLPAMEQVFVNAPTDIDEATFNRKLFMARRRTEKAIGRPVTRCSTSRRLSSSTIVYKGMVMPQYLSQFYAGPQGSASSRRRWWCFISGSPPTRMPQWRLAHPYRYLAHNGEINTVSGEPQLGEWRAARCFAPPYCRI